MLLLSLLGDKEEGFELLIAASTLLLLRVPPLLGDNEGFELAVPLLLLNPAAHAASRLPSLSPSISRTGI